jgi:hypothetical protein
MPSVIESVMDTPRRYVWTRQTHARLDYLTLPVWAFGAQPCTGGWSVTCHKSFAFLADKRDGSRSRRCLAVGRLTVGELEARYGAPPEWRLHPGSPCLRHGPESCDARSRSWVGQGLLLARKTQKTPRTLPTCDPARDEVKLIQRNRGGVDGGRWLQRTVMLGYCTWRTQVLPG